MSKGKQTFVNCTDKRCRPGEMCRQAAWGQYGIVCRGLADTDFDDGVCPFYKTRQQYNQEYKASNKFKKDPYL